jgi:hypothetical protein
VPPFRLLCRLIDGWVAGLPPAPDLVAAIADPATPWPRLVTLSGVHLMTPALAAALAEPILAAALPRDLEVYLAAMRSAAAARNDGLRCQLDSIAAALNQVGVVPVALKGAVRLVDRLWPERAARFMHDLDLLLPAAAAATSRRRLEADGWEVIETDEDTSSRHVAIARPGAPARVELHAAPLPAPYADLAPAHRLLSRAEPRVLGVATVALPALEDQIVHLVAHGMLQHAFLSTGPFLLRDLVELALLLRRADSGVAATAHDRFAAAGRRSAWEVCLGLAGVCLPRSMPRRGGRRLGAGDRLLVGRMVLQQRSPLLMQVLGPVGWAAARALGQVAGQAGGTTRLLEQLRTFRRKTHW